MSIKTKARRLAPESGRPYELFDCAVLLLVVSSLGYLSGFSRYEHGGVVVSVAAVIAIVASYCKAHTVEWGYNIAIAAALVVSVVYLGEIFVLGFSPRVLALIFVYCWVARRLLRVELTLDPRCKP